MSIFKDQHFLHFFLENMNLGVMAVLDLLVDLIIITHRYR